MLCDETSSDGERCHRYPEVSPTNSGIKPCRMLTCYLLTEPTLVVDHLYDLGPVVAKLVLVFRDTDTVGRPRVSSHGCQTNRLPGHNLYVRRQFYNVNKSIRKKSLKPADLTDCLHCVLHTVTEHLLRSNIFFFRGRFAFNFFPIFYFFISYNFFPIFLCWRSVIFFVADFNSSFTRRKQR